MKVMPTLEGGLRIDMEDADEWELFRAILVDASGGAVDLASRLGGLISEEAGAEDWEEYVVPDLREAFHDELAEVGAAIEAAIYHANGGPGPLWITREDVFPWYSALNQARLEIEECYRFGPGEGLELSSLPEETRVAFIRTQFYCTLQGMLLEYVMV